MNEVVNESLADFLEKAQRPGLLGLVGKTVLKRCTKDLKEYFTALGKRIVEMRLESLAEPGRGISAEHARHAVAMRMHNLLRSRQPLLKATLHQNIVEAIAAAGKINLLAEADHDDDNFDDDAAQPSDYVGMTADDAALYAANKVDSLITGLDQTSLNSVANAVSKGITDRLGVPGTARLIKDVVDNMSTYRAETIASYEMNDAMSQAFLKKLVRNAIEYKQWILGPNPCEICEENAEESPIPVDEDFSSGDACPPAHVNCFPAGTSVTALGSIEAAMTRWYEGEIVRIAVDGDDKIAPSVNHPILTLRGMIPAGDIQKGDYVFLCRNPRKAASLIDPNNHNAPTRIEEIASSLLMAGGVTSLAMPVTAVDFHGDGITDSEVNVVWSAGFLANDRQRREEIEQTDFVGRAAARAINLPASGHHALRTKAAVELPFSLTPESLSHFHAALTGPKSGGDLTSVSDFEAVTSETSRDRVTINAKASGDRIQSHPAGVHSPKLPERMSSLPIGDSPLHEPSSYLAPGGESESIVCKEARDLAGRTRHQLSSRSNSISQVALLELPESDDLQSALPLLGLRENGEAAFPEPHSQQRVGEPASSCELVDALAGHVETVQVSDVRREKFSGFVHNIQTATNHYIAGGLIVSNCVCAVAGARAPTL